MPTTPTPCAPRSNYGLPNPRGRAPVLSSSRTSAASSRATSAATPPLEISSRVGECRGAASSKAQAAPFQPGSTVGSVANTGGTAQAASGVCTHQGCLLRQNSNAASLDCPCHRASFSLDGEVITHELSQTPPPLPHLSVRERDGQVEVYTPPAV